MALYQQFARAQPAFLASTRVPASRTICCFAPSSVRESPLPSLARSSPTPLVILLSQVDLEEQLGAPIPEDVRNDPVKYEAFVNAHFDRQMQQGDPELRRRAEALIDSNPTFKAAQATKGGAMGFLDRFRKGGIARPIATSTRVKVVAVGTSEDKRASLLQNADHV